MSPSPSPARRSIFSLAAGAGLTAATIVVLLAGCGQGDATSDAEPTAMSPKAVVDDAAHSHRTTTERPAAGSDEARQPAAPPLRSAGSTPGSRLLDAAPARALTGGRGPSQAQSCDVDFDDSAAKSITGPSAWFDRIYIPWFQTCPTGQRVDIRPKVLGHVHLGFRDFDVYDCVTESPAGFPMKRVDGVCQDIDVATEPRTYITTHGADEVVQVRAYTADTSKYQRATFDLERIRVRGSFPVRLCYRKNTLDDVVNPGAPADSWDCFESLEPGYYDLSWWVHDVAEVTVTGVGGNYSLDDLRLSVSPVGF